MLVLMLLLENIFEYDNGASTWVYFTPQISASQDITIVFLLNRLNQLLRRASSRTTCSQNAEKKSSAAFTQPKKPITPPFPGITVQGLVKTPPGWHAAYPKPLEDEDASSQGFSQQLYLLREICMTLAPFVQYIPRPARQAIAKKCIQYFWMYQGFKRE